MVRPCVARGFVELASAVLHQCIRPLIGACAPGHHGYRRACDLITGQASTGHLGHQGSHAPGRPILHHRLILSQTRAGKGLIMSSIASWLCVVPLFVPSGRSFVPTCGRRDAPRAWTVKVGRRACLASRASVARLRIPVKARPRLDGPEHGARIKRVETQLHWS
jgi:hypothetical protein